jgi:cytochrome P450
VLVSKTERDVLPPGPRAPGLVQAVRLAADPIGYLLRLQRRYGDLFSLSFPGFERLVYVADPDLVKEIFRGDAERFHAGEASATVLEPAVGPSSVLTLDEGEHLRQRRLLLPPFHGESIRRYEEVIRDAARREIAGWPLGKPFALRPRTQAITLEVILRAVFGIEDPERLARAHRLTDRFERRSRAVLLFPFLRHDLGPASPWSRFRRARSALDELIYDQIRLRRAEPEAGGREDVLSLLLAARDEEGAPMSDSELRDELVTVIGAGHETTATALAWAVERLVRTPEVLAKLRRTIAAGDEDYLDAVAKETLRIRPVLADVVRRLTAPTELGGYLLPAGTTVMPAIVLLYHSPELFPDPERFRPERFLDAQPSSYSWIPFGGGLRRCVGAAFAQLEMRIVLREIFTRVELRAPRSRPERAKVRNITLTPANGATVIVDRMLPAPTPTPTPDQALTAAPA